MSPTRQRGVLGRKSTSVLSVLSVAESYKKQMRFSIHNMFLKNEVSHTMLKRAEINRFRVNTTTKFNKS